MAIRFESTHDDNGLWNLVAACSAYSDSRRSERPTPMPTIDLRLSSEMSDHDERGTSSCSPESCEHVGFCRINPTQYNGQIALGHTYQQPYSIDVGDNVKDLNRNDINYHRCSENETGNSLNAFPKPTTSEWPINENISKNIIDYRIPRFQTDNLQTSKTKTNQNKSSIPIYFEPTSTNFNGDLEYLRNTAYRSTQPPSRQQILATLKHEIDVNDKNGEAGTSKSKRSRIGSNQVESDKATSAKSIESMKNINNENKTNKVKTKETSSNKTTTSKSRRINLNKFEESDAVEALLGLSEGFFQTASSTKYSISTSVHDDAINKVRKATSVVVKTTASLTQPPPDKYLVETRNSSLSEKPLKEFPEQSCAVDVIKDSGECASGQEHPRFHFKKFICQKFANSLDRPKNNIDGDTSTSYTADIQKSSRCSSQNGDQTKSASQTDFSSENTNEEFTSTKTEENSKELNSDKNLEKHSNQKENNKEATKTDDLAMNEEEGKRTIRKSQKPTKSRNKINVIGDKRNCDKHLSDTKVIKLSRKSPIELSQNENKRKSINNKKVTKINKNESKSNLYRVSSSLGSSSETIYASDDDIDDVVATDSSSDGSSESDEETSQSDNKRDYDVTESVGKQSESLSDETPKRKMFVLNKPKFSLPAKDEKKVNFMNSNKDKNSFGNLDFSLKCNNSSRENLFSISQKKLFDSSSKQSTIHIKKATFTFSSSFKPENRSNGLSVTSQCSVPVDCTQQLTMVNSSFNLNKNKSEEISSRKIKHKNSNNKNSTKDEISVTFGTFREGDTFENLSKPTNERREKTSRDCKSTNHKSLIYDKDRLPRPSARSAHLEAQQTKTNRKRKVSQIKVNKKTNQKPVLSKRLKPSLDDVKRQKSRDSELSKKRHKETNDPETNKQANKIDEVCYISNGKLSTSGSSSRRKPARVFKHCKYTSMKSSNQFKTNSTDFTFIHRPLSLDDRLLLAKSIDSDPSSRDTFSTDSMIMTSSSSSRTSSIAGDENDRELNKKTVTSLTNKRKHRHRRHRSAADDVIKSDCLQGKQRSKKSVTEQRTRFHSDGNNLSRSTRGGSAIKGKVYFHLLSCFPAPASLIAGPAFGELLPGYGPSASGRRSTLPLRWKKGNDVTELKQRRQRDKWRNMTIDMFCMGAKS